MLVVQKELKDLFIRSVPETIPLDYSMHRPLPEKMLNRRDPMFDLFPGGEVVVEIGSQWGWWPYRALKHLPKNVKIYCVDPWPCSDVDKESIGDARDFYDWCLNLRNDLGKRIFGLRGKSEDIAEHFDLSIDYLFLDGDHHESVVYRDLELWWPKIRNGGVIVGHDWKGMWGANVRRAVHKFFGNIKIESDVLYWLRRGEKLSFCWWKKKK